MKKISINTLFSAAIFLGAGIALSAADEKTVVIESEKNAQASHTINIENQISENWLFGSMWKTWSDQDAIFQGGDQIAKEREDQRYWNGNLTINVENAYTFSGRWLGAMTETTMTTAASPIFTESRWFNNNELNFLDEDGNRKGGIVGRYENIESIEDRAFQMPDGAGGQAPDMNTLLATAIEIKNENTNDGYSEGKNSYMSSLGTAKGNITITGGGVLSYKGFSDINYYSKTYLVGGFQDANLTTLAFPTSLNTYKIYKAKGSDALETAAGAVWAEIDFFELSNDESAYSGGLTIEEGTTLKVEGYLTQQVMYVVLAMPGMPAAMAVNYTNPNLTASIVAGVQNVNLTGENAKISYASSPKNLRDTNFVTPNGDESAAGNADVALNFLRNVTAHPFSRIELGVKDDKVRLVIFSDIEYKFDDLDIDSDGDKNEVTYSRTESSIGILEGSGRLFLAGSGDFNIAGVAEFNNGDDLTGRTRLADVYILNTSAAEINTNIFANPDIDDFAVEIKRDADGNPIDEEGNIISTTNGIIDEDQADRVVLLPRTSTITRLGVLSPDSNSIVDNVLATATAIQLQARDGYAGQPTDMVGQPGGSGNSLTTIDLIVQGNNNTASFECRPAYLDLNGDSVSATVSADVLEIYGTQTLNNFQSLFVERASGTVTQAGYTEPITTSFAMRATGSFVVLRTDSSLILNILEDRDGLFSGTFIATNDTYELTAGISAGRTIDQLINEDKTVSITDGIVRKTGAGSMAMIAGNFFADRLYIDEGKWISDFPAFTQESTRIVIGDKGSIVLLVNSLEQLNVKIEGTGNGRFEIRTHESITNDGRSYHVSTLALQEGANTGRDGTASINRVQDNFTGSVVLGAGISLILGTNSWEAKNFIFPDAKEFLLEGTSNKTSHIIVNSHQILTNVSSGESNSIETSSYATVALNIIKGGNEFNGSISGFGNFVKLGTGSYTFNDSEKSLASYTGATGIVAGSIILNKENALAASSGVILINAGTTLSVEKGNQIFSALIGDNGTVVSMGTNNLTVGRTNLSDFINSFNKGLNNGEKIAFSSGYYFATYDNKGYVDLLKDTGGADKLIPGIPNRPIDRTKDGYEADGVTLKNGGKGEALTIDDTKAFISDPALLKVAFASAYAVITPDTYLNTFVVSTKWQTCFAGLKTEDGKDVSNLSEFIYSVFGETNIEAFCIAEEAKADSKWTTRQLKELRDFSKALKKGQSSLDEGFNAFDKDGSVSRNIFEALKNVYAIDYLREKYLSKLIDQTLPADEIALAEAQLSRDLETFYQFISIFVDNYEFQPTEQNLVLLQNKFGFNVDGWRDSDGNYIQGSFEDAVGVESLDFAGSITGAGKLIKVGQESLILTGNNSYTGATEIREGELKIDWDAIKNTSQIDISKGALFTIDTASASGTASLTTNKISGAGTILKVGAPELVIENAFSETSDFSGSLVVGEGKLRVNIANRSIFEGSVYLNLDTEFIFDFIEQKDETTNETIAQNMVFSGVVSGSGAFVMKGSDSATLTFTNSKAITNIGIQQNLKETQIIRIENGVMIAQLNSTVTGINHTFRNALGAISVADGAKFVLETNSENQKITYAGQVLDVDNNLTVENGGSTFEKRGVGTLILSGGIKGDEDKWTVENLILSGGTIEIVGERNVQGVGNVKSSYSFNKIETKVGTTLVVNGGLTFGEAIFDGALKGTGTIGVNNGGNVVLTTVVGGSTVNVSEFTGAIELNNSNLVLENESGTVEYNVSVKSTAATSWIIKKGAGNVNLSNKIDFKDLAIAVEAGKLSLDGSQLIKTTIVDDTTIPPTTTESNTLEATIYIANGAILEIDPLNIDLNGSTLYGEGVLSLGSGTVELDGLTFKNGKPAPYPLSDAATNSGLVTILTSTDTILKIDEITTTKIGGIVGPGTLQISRSGDLILDQAVDDISNVFTGKFENISAGDLNLIFSGSGLHRLSDGANDATFSNVTTQVGNSTNAGHIGISSSQNQLFTIVGDDSSVSILNDINGDSTNVGKIELGVGLKKFTLAAQGELNAAKKLNSIFEITGEVETLYLANNKNEMLSISNVESLESGLENTNVVLKTQASLTAASYAAGIEILTSDGERLLTDIEGDGDILISGSNSLTVVRDNLSFSGKMRVGNKAMLIADNNTLTLNVSELSVEGTLKGSIVMANKDSVLAFGVKHNVSGQDVYIPALLELDLSKNEQVQFAGTAKGKIDLNLINVDWSKRGTPITLIKYIGEKNPLETETPINTIELGLTGYNSVKVMIDEEIQQSTGDFVVYLAQDNLKDIVGVDLHEGMGSFVDKLSEWTRPNDQGKLDNQTRDSEFGDIQNELGKIINKSSVAEVNPIVMNLSALAYGSMISMPRTGFNNDKSFVLNRLEQRRADNRTLFLVDFELENDWEFFVESQSNVTNSDESSVSGMNYDYNMFGALAGADVKLGPDTTVGFALAYDYAKANVHHSGGKIEMNDIRLLAFAGKRFGRVALDFGADAGAGMFDIKRNNILGNNTADANAWHAGAFASLSTVLPIYVKDFESLMLVPKATLALSHYFVESIDEKGSVAALNSDSFSGTSLQASVGLSLTWAFLLNDLNNRLSLDVEYTRECLDSDVDIDSKFIGADVSVSANAMEENVFSIGPRYSINLDDTSSIWAGYSFAYGTESETSHNVNVGYRKRF